MDIGRKAVMNASIGGNLIRAIAAERFAFTAKEKGTGMKSNGGWAIFCPGQSLTQVKKDLAGRSYCPGMAVAVNCAILTGLPVRFWAVTDPEVFNSVVPGLKMKDCADTKLFFPNNWLDHKNRFFPDPAIRDILDAFPQYPYWGAEEIRLTMPFDLDIDWNLTVFKAIALAVTNGARDIKIYGMDMRGDSYFMRGQQNERTQHTSRRWKAERADFEKLKKACGECGIRIARIAGGGFV